MIKGNFALSVIIGLMIVGLLATTLFLFYQNIKLQNASDVSTFTPTATVTPTVYSENETPTPSTPAVSANATLIFETEANFTDSDKSQITSRIIEPFLMYYSDQHGSGYVKTLTISINTQPNKSEYPYLAKYVFKDAVNGGFVITKTDGNIDWWIPECMGPCPFSDSFRNKYPEISKIAG